MRSYSLQRLPSGLITTRAALHGDGGVASVQLVIDTGALYTVIHPSFLEKVGATPQGEVPVRTLERTLSIPAFTVQRLSVFGASLEQQSVLAYAPAAFISGIECVLSITILQSIRARVDFSSHILTIP